MLVFEEGGKTRLPREKTIGARMRINNKLNHTYEAESGNQPRPHWWETSALTTVPSLLPAALLNDVQWMWHLLL